MEKKYKQILFIVILGVTLLVALLNFRAVTGAIGVFLGLFMPLIVGAAIAFILNVPMVFFEKQFERLDAKFPSRFLQKGKGALSLIITLILFCAAVYVIGMVIFPNMVESIKTIAVTVKQNYPAWIELAESKGIDMTIVKAKLAELDWDKFVNTLKSHSGTILSSVGQAATSVFGIFANAAFGMIFAIYILLNKKKLGIQAKKITYAYLKREWADEICDIAGLSYKTFSGFLSGQCVEAVILGLMFFVSLLIGGFPYAGTIAVIIGCMSIIPFVGAFIGMAFGILMIAVTSIKQALWFVILFFIIQQIEGHIVYPKVVGGSVGLPAIWTLLAVVVGGKVSGVFGIILFIPLFSVLYALIRRSVYTRLKKKQLVIK